MPSANYPTCDEVVRAVIAAYNERADTLGHGYTASASLPVKMEDVLDVSIGVRSTPQAPCQCRSIAVYTIYHNVRHKDPFGGEGRYVSRNDIGRYFKRSPHAMYNALMGACRLLEDDRYRAIYDAATTSLKAQGFDLCGIKSKDCTRR